MLYLIPLLLLALPLPAQTAYRVSVATTIGCAAADATSSYGRVELNPALRDASGRLSGRSVAIKAGITGAILGVGWLVQRRKLEARRAVTIGNWVTSAAWCGAAAHNWAAR